MSNPTEGRTFEEALVECRECHGLGTILGPKALLCPDCQGAGKVPCFDNLETIRLAYKLSVKRALEMGKAIGASHGSIMSITQAVEVLIRAEVANVRATHAREVEAARQQGAMTATPTCGIHSSTRLANLGDCVVCAYQQGAREAWREAARYVHDNIPKNDYEPTIRACAAATEEFERRGREE